MAWSVLVEVYSRTHYSTTDPATAQRALDKAKETSQADIGVYGPPVVRDLVRCNLLALGGYMESGHKWEEALGVYSGGRGEEEVVVGIARCLVGLGRVGEAKERLVASGMETAGVMGMRGWCAFLDGDTTETAVGLLEKATALDPLQGYYLGE